MPIRKSPSWDQNVNFTLKQYVLYDIDRRRSDYLNYRISQTENETENRSFKDQSHFFSERSNFFYEQQ